MQYRKIILIAIDTLNVDHLGCYEYNVPKTPTTPFIDSLAEKGAIFRRHYATDVPTPPSFTSLFCGNRGIRHGIIGFNNKATEFKCDTPLLAECFAKNGFKTGMISNLLYPSPWLKRGFHDLYPPGSRFQGGTAEEVTDKAISMLKDYQGNDFFLFVHYWDPHVPYLARSKEEYRKMFSPDEYEEFVPDMKYFERNKFLKIIYERKREKGSIFGSKHEKANDPLEPAENLALYDANIRYVDDNIGRLFSCLERLGIDKDTLAVISSDHGEAFGEYGFWDHYSSYRNISQLPLIIAGPNIKRTEISAYTQNIDVMPTILELAEIDVPKGLDGRTMIPLLEGKRKSFRKEAIANSDATVVQRMFVKEEYALVYTPARPIWNHIKEYELFNLSEDPAQVNDISEKEKKRTVEMRIALGDWTAKMLNGRPDPLWLSVYRGGWMWRSLCALLKPSELEKVETKYPEIKRILEIQQTITMPF